MGSSQAQEKVEQLSLDFEVPEVDVDVTDVPEGLKFDEIDSDKITKALKALDMFVRAVAKLVDIAQYSRAEATEAAFGLVKAATDFDLRKAMHPLKMFRPLPVPEKKSKLSSGKPIIQKVNTNAKSAVSAKQDLTPNTSAPAEPPKVQCDPGVKPSGFVSAKALVIGLRDLFSTVTSSERREEYNRVRDHFSAQAFYTFMCDRFVPSSTEYKSYSDEPLPTIYLPKMVHYRSGAPGRGVKSVGYAYHDGFPDQDGEGDDKDMVYAGSGYWWFNKKLINDDVLRNFSRFIRNRIVNGMPTQKVLFSCETLSSKAAAKIARDQALRNAGVKVDQVKTDQPSLNQPSGDASA